MDEPKSTDELIAESIRAAESLQFWLKRWAVEVAQEMERIAAELREWE